MFPWLRMTSFSCPYAAKIKHALVVVIIVLI
jgi:hypothetical protein